MSKELPELLTVEQWSPECVAFRRKLIGACIHENLHEGMNHQQLSKAIFDMAEECFIMGGVYGGNVYTDEEIEEMNKRAFDKIQNMEAMKNAAGSNPHAI